MNYLIVGNSAAGVSAALEVRARDPRARLVILSDEVEWGYCRIALPPYLEGTISWYGLETWPRRFYDEHRLELHRGERAVALRPRGQTVETASGRRYRYDRLLIATGARAEMPAIPGIDLRGVHPLHSLADARAIAERIAPGSKAVVVGGGLVSLKAAVALHHRAMEVEMVVASRQLLSRTVDSTAASLVREALESHGILVRTGSALAHLGGSGGQIGWVQLEDETRLSCDLVIVGKGVTPNVEWLAASGVEVSTGIRVDRHQRTSVPNVYAAGDVAAAPDLLTGEHMVAGIWPAAVQQGQIAGANMAGEELTYEGNLAMNTVTLFGITAASVGNWRSRDDTRSLQRLDREARTFRRIVLREGHMEGAVVVSPGDTTAMGLLRNLLERRAEISALEQELVWPSFGFGQWILATQAIHRS